MKISNQNLNTFLQFTDQENVETSQCNVSQELVSNQSYEVYKEELLILSHLEGNPLKRKALDNIMSAELMMFLGQKHLANSNHELASEYFLKAAEECEEGALAWLKIIKVPEHLKDRVAEVFLMYASIFQQKAMNFNQRKENFAKSFELYHAAASLDHPKATYELAEHYYQKYDEENQQRAKLLYEKAASLGYERAFYDLGAYFEDEGDFSEAAALYMKAPNCVEAVYRLASFYLGGYEGIEPDFNRGLIFLIQAARMDCNDYELKDQIMSNFTKLDIPAEFSEEVALLLFNSSKDLDYDWSIDCLKKAADMGFPPALTILGYCYEQGNEVNRDMNKAIESYKKAAEKNDPQAQLNLGRYYLKESENLESKLFMATELLIKAATQGNEEALIILKDIQIPSQLQEKAAELFFKSAVETPQLEDKIVFERLQKAVILGHSKALCYLGIHYEKGVGTIPDKKKALEYYNEALRQNVPAANYYLGRFCRLYRHRDEDIERALEYYLKAAFLRVSDAVNDLLWMEIPPKFKAKVGEILFIYATDERTCKYLAFECLKKASDLDHVKAISVIGTYYEQGIGTSIDLVQAYLCYRKAAERHDLEAFGHLSRCYLQGIGVQTNQVLATHYQKLAANMINR